MLIVTAKRADMCYCPGCSHGMILEALGKAIDRLCRPSHEICIVSDIGCIGTADRYFSCHTFHGLHGRSLSYAEGIKRARPDLLVIVLIGDGGCGIGTAHLVHGARRDAGIKIVVCNNFNFGMTGGQHSATTPCDAKTTTTPCGATDHPFDICATVAANGASFVARHDVFDARLVDHLEEMLRAPGFALVDIWELCTAYFVPSNRLNRGSLAELSDRLGMPFGMIRHHLPPVSAQPVEDRRSAPIKRNGLSPNDSRVVRLTGLPAQTVPALPWNTRREITVAGSAGQRIRSALGVIGELAVSSGLHAAQQDDFPITVRKGFSVSSLIVSPDPILYTGLDHPDLVVLLSKDGTERFGDLSALAENCSVVVDNDLPIGDTPARVIPMVPSAWEKELAREAVSLAAVAFAFVVAGLIAPDLLSRAAEAGLSGPYREENLRAIRLGAAQTEVELRGCTFVAASGGQS